MNCFYKKIVLILVIISGLMSLRISANDNFSVTLEPAAVMEGENFVLQITSSSNEPFELMEQPEGFRYLGSQRSTHIINGKRTNTAGYVFAAPAPGKYTIPPLSIKFGKQISKTPELTLEVAKNEIAGISEKDIFTRYQLPRNREFFYVGETIPLTIKVYYPPKVKLQFNYPKLDIGKSVFLDFRGANPENPYFMQPMASRQIIDDKLCEEIAFFTAFRPLAAGQLPLQGSINSQILIPEKSSRSRNTIESFITGAGHYRRIDRVLKLDLPEITVKELPPPPAGSFFLGVIGDCNGQVALSATKVKALEPFTLDITLQGHSDWETLKVPDLTLPECRVYPGEVRRSENNCIISYAVIPLQAGKQNIQLDFCFFKPGTGSYEHIRLASELQIAPAAQPIAPDAPETSARKNSSESEDTENKSTVTPAVRTTLLYCKTAPSSNWTLFWERNRPLAAALMFIAGPLIWLIVCIGRKIRNLHQQNPNAVRRERAGARRSELIEKIRKSPSEALPRLATGEIAAFLSDRWQLPPGSTLEEIADKAQDPDLRSALKECAQASYLPPQLAASALQDAGKIRAILISAVKCIVWCLLPMFAFSASSAETAGQPQDWASALHAYDQGDYAGAKIFFKKYLHENGTDPNVLYNLACIAEASGDQENALWLLESAALLNPQDTAIHENRNVMRRKFFWPDNNSSPSPVELLKTMRDRLHPENYLVAAAFFWMLFFLLLVWRKRIGDPVMWGIGAGLLGAAFLSLILMFCQYLSTYRDDQALIVAKNAELYSFPGTHNGQSSGSLPGGTPVTLIEQQPEYSLIRGRDQEGWTKNQNIRKLLQ